MLLRQLAFSTTCPDPECQIDLSDRTDSFGHLHIVLGTWSQYVHLDVYGRCKYILITLQELYFSDCAIEPRIQQSFHCGFDIAVAHTLEFDKK